MISHRKEFVNIQSFIELKIQLETMIMTMKISLFDINHLNTIRKNKAEQK